MVMEIYDDYRDEIKRWQGKNLHCVKDYYHHELKDVQLFKKGEFCKLVYYNSATHPSDKDFIKLKSDVFGTYSLWLDEFFDYFELKTKKDVRLEKIKKIIDL
jgi:hypothetical protein